MSNTKKNVAVVGCGKWGQNLIKTLNEIATIKYCVHQTDSDNARWVKENFTNINLTKNIDDALNDETIDAVFIATPIETQHKLTKQALLADKHVFVEKPMGDTIKHAKEIIALSLNINKRVFVGYSYLYDEAWQKLVSLVNDKDMSIYTQWNKTGTFKEDILLNLLSHHLSHLTHLFRDTPKNIEIVQNKNVVSDSDIFQCNLQYADNKIASCAINRVSPIKSNLITIVTNDQVYSWQPGTLYQFDQETKKYTVIYESKELLLTSSCKNFLESLDNTKEHLTNTTMALIIQELLHEIKEKRLAF